MFNLRNLRRFATIRSAPQSPSAPSTVSEWAASQRGNWTTLAFIAGTGTFGAYEIYKGLFLVPPKEISREIVVTRIEKIPRDDKAPIKQSKMEVERPKSIYPPNDIIIPPN
jgi:hypothetical protein